VEIHLFYPPSPFCILLWHLFFARHFLFKKLSFLHAQKRGRRRRPSVKKATGARTPGDAYGAGVSGRGKKCRPAARNGKKVEKKH
jgi:hypothetical protein